MGGPADHREIIFCVLGLIYRTLRLFLFDSGLGPTAALGFSPMAQSRSGFDGLDSLLELFSIAQTIAMTAGQSDHLSSLRDIVFDRLSVVGALRGCVSGYCRGKLSVKGQSVSLPEVSFAGLGHHVFSQLDFQAIQPGFGLFLLLKKACPFGIADSVVSCGADSRRESFVSLGELNHLRVLGKLGLLLG